MDIKGFINQARRVMKIARKPDYAEFERMFKIVGVAAFAIGFIGFVISFLFSLIG